MKLLTSGCGVIAALALICIAVGQEKDRPKPEQVKKTGVIFKAPGSRTHDVALTADGKTVAWGGAEEKDKKITGTAHVWEVGSLATAPREMPKELQKPPAKKTPPEQVTPAQGKKQGTV